MSFANEVKDSTKAIKDFAHMQLRSQFPYMKTEGIEELLTKTTKQLISGLEQKEQEMRAVQSRTSFFSLSAELRNTIYEIALKVEDGIDVSRKIVIRQHTGLLFVSRQVYEEAISIWYAVNIFKFDIGDPYYWPHSQMEPEDRSPAPQDVSKWLRSIGTNAAWITSISLEVDLPDQNPAKNLWDLLTFSDLEFTGLTLHHAVLKSADLLDGDMDLKVFTMAYRGESMYDSAQDLYQAADVDGNELLTDELWSKILRNKNYY